VDYSPLEAFLISIQDDYDAWGVNNVGIKFMAKHKDVVTANTIRKTMSKLRKYGQLKGGVARLDEDENMMMKDGSETIDKTGVRTYCRNLAKITGKSENGLRAKYSNLKKFGVIK
tara:strand:+ start:175 stop:519 length:345 start_codon:yes stop_codon:yes gene_type:complete